MEGTYHAKFGGSTMFRLGCIMQWAELGGIIFNYEEFCSKTNLSAVKKTSLDGVSFLD